MTKNQRRIKKQVVRSFYGRRVRRCVYSVYFEPHTVRGQRRYIVTACERGFARQNMKLHRDAREEG